MQITPDTSTLLAEFYIPKLPSTTNAMNRMHWSKRAKEASIWKRLVALHCIQLGVSGQNLVKARLELIRHSAREPDYDGLVSGFKHVIDGLVESKVIVDDKPSVIGSPVFKWVKAKSNAGGITVKVFSSVD